jgi:hypothetical protein
MDELVERATGVAQLKRHLRTVAIMCRSMNAHIRMGKQLYCCFDEFTLANGRAFESSPLTPEERKIVMAASKVHDHDFQAKRCFYNSMRLVLADTTGQIQYVEGMCLGIIPFHHAWATINGKVVDVTLRHPPGIKAPNGCGYMGNNRSLGWFPIERVYIGTEFSRQDVQAKFSDGSGEYSIIDNWRADWPVLKMEPRDLVVMGEIATEADAITKLRQSAKVADQG